MCRGGVSSIYCSCIWGLPCKVQGPGAHTGQVNRAGWVGGQGLWCLGLQSCPVGLTSKAETVVSSL